MNTTNNEWIKFSDRKPVAADFPLFAWTATAAPCGEHYFQFPIANFSESWTHWRSSQKVAPPPKELTQHEKDHAANQRIHDEWYSTTTRVSLVDFAQRIRADERREILAMLDAAMQKEAGRNWCEETGQGVIATPAFRAIRARLETQGE